MPATITVKLDKKKKCSSLAANGSDFSISPAKATVTAAAAAACRNGFDMDSVILTLSNPLPAGNYNIAVKIGSDGNTLLDNCDRDIAAGKSLPLAILPLAPTPMDSLATVKCAPTELQLVFSKNIRCNSIAADGSDFIVTGPGNVSVVSAAGICNNGVSEKVVVKLSAAVVRAGHIQLHLKRGGDGNTLLDECGRKRAGSTLSFTLKDTVSQHLVHKYLWVFRYGSFMFMMEEMRLINGCGILVPAMRIHTSKIRSFLYQFWDRSKFN
jgi:hypothetical protein